MLRSIGRRLFLAACGTAMLVGTASAQQVVNVYTTREPALAAPLFEAFTKATGITVNSVFVKDGLAERVKAEGAASPADLLMTVDVGNLLDVVDAGVTQRWKARCSRTPFRPICVIRRATGSPSPCARA